MSRINILSRRIVLYVSCRRGCKSTEAMHNPLPMKSFHPSQRGLHTTSKIKSLAARIPSGTWDTHMHVVEPDLFPLDAAAKYSPSSHTLDQAKVFLSSIGINNMIIVQPSIYGNDNACTLDALKRLGPKHGRAVIQFDPDVTSRDRLEEWHEIGVRGVRINFKSVGVEPSAAELKVTLRKYADAVRPFGWPLELYISLENVPLLEPLVQDLGVKFIVDHLGHPRSTSLAAARSAHDIKGFPSLLRLLKQGNTWVKISATYRLSSDPSNKVVKSVCKEVLRTRPDRAVFATDWPHTRFDNIDVSKYLEKTLDWIEEEGINPTQVLVKNAEVLFDAVHSSRR